MIDCHVHLRDWEQAQKETLAHGIAVAMRAGITAVFDMPNTAPPLITPRMLTKRISDGCEAAKKVTAISKQAADKNFFYGVYAGLTDNSEQLATIVKFYQKNFPHCVGLKMFAGNSTGNMGLVTEAQQRLVYQVLTKLQYKGVLAVHCEKESFLHNELFSLAAPETHSTARPDNAEVQSISDQIRFVRETGFTGHLHICHISTAEGLQLVCDAKKSGMNISCGATPHHALLNMETYKKHGLYAKMNPPLRSEENRRAIFAGLLDGSIDNIESDHAPHTCADKKRGASGVPGFAGYLHLVKALRAAGCTENRLINLCGENINRIFGTQLAVTVPDNNFITAAVQEIAGSYPFDIFGK